MIREIDQEAYKDAYARVGGLEERGAKTWPPIISPGANWELFVDKGILNDILARQLRYKPAWRQKSDAEVHSSFVTPNSTASDAVDWNLMR